MTTISKSLVRTQQCVKKLCNRIEKLEYKDTTYGQNFYNPDINDGNGYTFAVGVDTQIPGLFNILVGNGNNIIINGNNKEIEYNTASGCYKIKKTGVYNINSTSILSINTGGMVASRLQRVCEINNANNNVIQVPEGIGNYAGHVMSEDDTKTFICNSITDFSKNDEISLISSFTSGIANTADINVHSWNFTAIKIDNN